MDDNPTSFRSKWLTLRFSGAAQVGDFDDDGDVDADDIDIVWHIVRGTGIDPNFNDSADLNGDASLSPQDVDYMLAHLLDAGPGILYGDADLDHDVDSDDYDMWYNRPGYLGPGTGHWSIGDWDGDRDVDDTDLEFWTYHPATYAAVPEPSTMLTALLGIGLVAALHHHHRAQFISRGQTAK